MKITIVQSEIEKAIENYVLGQLNVAENQELKITFKSTRGEDGATADIDIFEKAAKPAVKPTPVTRAVEKPAETKVETTPATTSFAAAAATQATEAAKPVETVTETKTAEAPFDVGAAADTTAAITEHPLKTTTLAGADEPTGEPAAPLGKALFGNNALASLTRPSNS